MAAEAMCELDPITWDAFIDAMQAHGVEEAAIGGICHDALRTINGTPESERSRLSAAAAGNFADRQAELS